MRGAGLEERGAGNRAQGAEGGGGRLRLGKARGSRGARIQGIFPSPEPKRPSGNRRGLLDSTALALAHGEWRSADREGAGP